MRIILVLIMFAFSFPAFAEEINITADDRVEFHQKENKMVAVGNAVASKKDMNIKAHKMTAFYEKTGQKSGIKSMSAEGNVIMHSPKADGFGDTLDYDLKKDIAILKGAPAKIKTEKETISATDSIIYYPSQQKAIATGDVAVSDGENSIYSNNLTAYFNKGATGALDIEKVEIFDNVTIKNKDTTVTALRGVYHPKTGIVNLYENVVIKQGENVLKGDMAESNLNTGVSRLISKSGNSGRVSGTFKEKSKSNGK